MGQDIQSSEFTPNDYVEFAGKVREELDILRQILGRKGFGHGENSIGAELEFYIVDDSGAALGINEKLLAEFGQSQLQPELNKFNIEYNLKPQPLSGKPFSALEAEILTAWQQVDQLAQPHGGRLIPIGILPTLKKSDFGPQSMTDIPRYQALADGLRRMRGKPFEVAINGRDQLHITADDVTLEGANTSFQFHWRVPMSEFIDTFNAVQLLTPLTVALSANSPFLLHHDLWDETRISLFKQSVDVRGEQLHFWREPARVDFGQGWLRRSPMELFELAASLYPPLLPVVAQEDYAALLSGERLPELKNLKLHHGTTWTWNRAIYDATDNGHLRMELRAMPAGPTIRDMLASAAFTIGCAKTLHRRIDSLIGGLPFRYAEHNFYAAARKGLESSLIWPDKHQVELREKSIVDIITPLIPLAREGLLEMGVAQEEVDNLLALIQQRLETRQTGASWQRKMVQKLERTTSRKEACAQMFQQYMANQKTGQPVAEWSLDA